MKSLALISLALTPCLYAQAEVSHQDFALSVLDFLSEVELCLSQCQDAESIAAQQSTLEQLSKKSAELEEIQKKMSDPIIADYISAEKHVEEFNSLYDAILAHIQRLKDEGLYTKELQTILKI